MDDLVHLLIDFRRISGPMRPGISLCEVRFLGLRPNVVVDLAKDPIWQGSLARSTTENQILLQEAPCYTP